MLRDELGTCISDIALRAISVDANLAVEAILDQGAGLDPCDNLPGTIGSVETGGGGGHAASGLADLACCTIQGLGTH